MMLSFHTFSTKWLTSTLMCIDVHQVPCHIRQYFQNFVVIIVPLGIAMHFHDFLWLKSSILSSILSAANGILIYGKLSKN